MKTFFIYWMHSHCEPVKGNDIADAFRRAGYSKGALGAVDFYDESDVQRYEWDQSNRKWKLKPQHQEELTA